MANPAFTVSTSAGPDGAELHPLRTPWWGGLAVTRTAYEVKSMVAGHPRIAMPTARLRRRHGIVVGPNTEIVIEGYPRSANNFAVIAFGLAQPRPVTIAHHTHAPAQLIAAVDAGIPALMLIREPVDAVLELLIAKPALTVGGALRGYIRFAERLLPMRDRLAVGRFPVVTTDFARVIRAVNDRFGSGFAEFDHTDANVRRCFAEMDRHWASRGADRLTIERRVGRPSALRDRYKESLRATYQRPELGRLRSHAENLYHAFDTDPLAQGSTDQIPRGADTPSVHRHTD